MKTQIMWYLLVVFVITGAALGSTKMWFGLGKQADKTLYEIADELNAKLPMMVTADIRLDSVLNLNGEFRYSYTLVNYSIVNHSPEGFREAVEPKLVKDVCSNSDMVPMLAKAALAYAYYDKDSKLITVIPITQHRCDGHKDFVTPLNDKEHI